MSDIYAAGLAAAREAGDADVKALLARIRHLPHNEQLAILTKEEQRLKTVLYDENPDFRRLQRLDSMVADLDHLRASLKAWENGHYRLGRLPHSLMHKLLEAANEDRVEFGSKDTQTNAECVADFIPRLKRSVPFVLEHDWAAAFAEAADFDDGDWKTPFDDTVFEFRVDGRHVAIFYSADGERLMSIQLGGGWFVSRANGEMPGWMARLIRAACIALDANVAYSDAVRASEKLNRARLAKGKLPLLDYHVIRLAKQSRVKPLDEHEPSGRHMRLHFVRGHWRHFETHKTWIKWHLRGDPDLGFIDKHYRL